MANYTSTEMMAVCGAHAVRDGERVFAGTGLPVLGAMLAKVTHAPNAIIIYEGGNVDCRNKDLALSVADSRLSYRAAASIGLIETLGFLMMGGRVDVGFLGAAQIDEFGNINTSYIGDFESPKVRLPGSGGGNDIASSAGRVVLMFTHDARKFVRKLDYLTSPGHLSGPGSREKLGLRGGGPALVVTDKCQMDFDPDTLRIRLKSVHPGVTIDWVKQNVMFDLIVQGQVPTTPEPTAFELRKLRGLDRRRIYLGKGEK